MGDVGQVSPPHRLLSKVPALDGLRGIAVLLVIIYHCPILLRPGEFAVGRWSFKGAFLGVDVFFVLSGFLITALLLGEQTSHGSIRLGSFYWRRALRLLPALVVLLGVHVLYAWATGLSLHVEWLTVRAALAYVSNWSWKWDGLVTAPGLGHLWSLSVEEQYYLVWPALMVFFFTRRRRSGPVLWTLLAAIVAVCVRRVLLWQAGSNVLFVYQRTDTRADSLLVGTLLAQLWARRLIPQRCLAPAAWLGTATLAVIIAFVAPDRAFLYLGGFTLVAVCVAAVLIASVERAWAGVRLLEVSPLRALGRVSYGLYLWHLPVFVGVLRYGANWSPWLRVFAGLGLSAAFTLASWRLVERPFQRLRGRSRRPRPLDATAETRSAPAT